MKILFSWSGIEWWASRRGVIGIVKTGVLTCCAIHLVVADDFLQCEFRIWLCAAQDEQYKQKGRQVSKLTVSLFVSFHYDDNFFLFSRGSVV